MHMPGVQLTAPVTAYQCPALLCPHTGITTKAGHAARCCRSRALQDRIRLLEQQLQQQEQRLKGYVPQTQVVPHVEANAPDGTLLYRLENLEMGMDVLLRAQELQWQESAKGGKKKARSCCCCVM